MSRNYQRSVTGGVATELKYYDLGGQVLAMRTNGVLNYILSDHLGSTSLTTDGNGVQTSETRYTAFGEIRVTSGTVPTEYKYTGQMQVEAGLYFYVSRFFDPYLSHFVSADTLVPDAGSAMGYDRYAYVGWNPIVYNDPSGQSPEHCPEGDPYCNNYIPTMWNFVIKNIEYLQKHPPKINSLFIDTTILIPGGYGQEMKAIHYVEDLSPLIRGAGRGLGDSAITFTIPIGIFLTNYPSQRENYLQKAPLSDYIADAIVDTAGWGISELFGKVVEGFGGLNPSSILAGVAMDIYVGRLYDNFIYESNVREFTSKFIEENFLCGRCTSNFKPYPIPTPDNPNLGKTPQPHSRWTPEPR